jgi:type VI secretion system protein ImpK
MSASDDPFGFNDGSRTLLDRGGTAARTGASPVRARGPAGAAAVGQVGLPMGTPGRGPLVQAGCGLLALAPLLRTHTGPGDPAALRQAVERELERYQEALRGRGIDPSLARLGHYCLSALLDDVVLNTPWGAHSDWPNNSLVGTLHHDAAAGEHFFTYLDQARRAPERLQPALELMAACLALGFEGRYRLLPGGGEALRQIRLGVAAELARLDSDPSPDLSGHWQGIPVPHRRVAARIPLWVWGSLLLVLLLIVYAGLTLRLGIPGARLDALVAALPPGGAVEITRAAPAVPPPPNVQALAPALRDCLGGPAVAGPDGVVEDASRVRVRLPANGLFASGQADLRPTVAPAIVCLREVLANAPGRVVVVGHTDTVPIHTVAFPDNWALSRARADAVAAIFRTAMPGPQRLSAVGRAGTDPIAPNTDEQGRARNRRVEIVLVK